MLNVQMSNKSVNYEVKGCLSDLKIDSKAAQ